MQACALIIKQRMQPLGAAEAELQRHRAVVADDQITGAMHLLDPVGQLSCIGNRC